MPLRQTIRLASLGTKPGDLTGKLGKSGSRIILFVMKRNAWTLDMGSGILSGASFGRLPVREASARLGESPLALLACGRIFIRSIYLCRVEVGEYLAASDMSFIYDKF